MSDTIDLRTNRQKARIVKENSNPDLRRRSEYGKFLNKHDKTSSLW